MRCILRGCNTSRNGNEMILCLTHSDIFLRTVICTQSARYCTSCSCGGFKPIRSVLIHGMCIFEDGFRAATAASLGAPSFRRTQAPFASTTTSCSCSPWFFVLLFPHGKNFAFIFDMQALVRLFLPCGSPCVRSTSDCAVLLATLGAQSAVA